jgi:hypothetical protein
MLLECSLNVARIFPKSSIATVVRETSWAMWYACSLKVDPMSPECETNAPSMWPKYSLNVAQMFPKYSLLPNFRYCACPEEGCNKKVTEESGAWYCVSHQQSFPTCNRRYIASMQVRIYIYSGIYVMEMKLMETSRNSRIANVSAALL